MQDNKGIFRLRNDDKWINSKENIDGIFFEKAAWGNNGYDFAGFSGSDVYQFPVNGGSKIQKQSGHIKRNYR